MQQRQGEEADPVLIGDEAAIERVEAGGTGAGGGAAGAASLERGVGEPDVGAAEPSPEPAAGAPSGAPTAPPSPAPAPDLADDRVDSGEAGGR